MNLAVGNSKKLVSKSHLLHPRTPKATRDQQYANSKKFAYKNAVQQELEEEASEQVARAQSGMSFNKNRKLLSAGAASHKKQGASSKQHLSKKLGVKGSKRSAGGGGGGIDVGLEKDEFKALLMAQTEAYSKRPGVTSLVNTREESKKPNKHSELWLAKHGSQDEAAGSGGKKMTAEDAVAKNLAVAKTQAEAATDTPEELATLAPQVAESAAAPAAIAAAMGAVPFAASGTKSKFDCVSLSPTATDNWCLTMCGVSMTSCPKTICRCELSVEAPAAAAASNTEFAAASVSSGGGLADTTDGEGGDEEEAEEAEAVPEAQDEDSEASAAEALAKAEADAEAEAEDS